MLIEIGPNLTKAAIAVAVVFAVWAFTWGASR